jgi:hypothetical protein
MGEEYQGESKENDEDGELESDSTDKEVDDDKTPTDSKSSGSSLKDEIKNALKKK